MIKTMDDVFKHIEKQYSRKISEGEKVIIRFRMIVLRESVQIIFKDIGIDQAKLKFNNI